MPKSDTGCAWLLILFELVELVIPPRVALLDKEEEDPKDFRELKVDLNNLEAAVVPFELAFDAILFVWLVAVERGGNLPTY